MKMTKKRFGLGRDRFAPVGERPLLFLLGDSLAYLAISDDGPALQLMTRDQVYGLLVREIDWVTVTTDDDGNEVHHPAQAPKDLVGDVLGIPPANIPRVERTITTPVFGSDGKLLVEPGLHREARIWHHPDTSLVLPSLPDIPSAGDVKAALDLFLCDLLVDFVFASDADRAHALALILLPFARALIQGATPFHLVESPTPGTGKNLAADLVSLILTGVVCESTTVPESADEIQKVITAELMRNRQIVLLDNLPDATTLDSATLASVATALTWKGRFLGQSKMLTLPNRAVWIITGNNPSLSPELGRRCVRIRIESNGDRPWLRTGFKHDPLREWVLDNRPRLVHAAHVLVQSWVAGGMQLADKTLGSFESWARVMGGILDNAGVEGFLGNLLEMYEAVDEQTDEWRAFVGAWHQLFKDEPASVGDLDWLCQNGELMTSVRGAFSEHSRKVRLGIALHKARDRVYDGLRIVIAKDDPKKGRSYKLVVVDPAALDAAQADHPAPPAAAQAEPAAVQAPEDSDVDW